MPLIGFVGGPFTVASYAVEGGSQGFTRLKTLLWSDPAAAHALFEKLTRAAVVQLEAQVAAGAEAAQVFESWLGELAREDLEAVQLPLPGSRIAEAIRRAGVPGILFSTGTTAHLERLASLGYDVLSVDWRIPIAEARARAGAGRHPGQPRLHPAARAGRERGGADPGHAAGGRAANPVTSSTSATACRWARRPRPSRRWCGRFTSFTWS